MARLTNPVRHAAAMILPARQVAETLKPPADQVLAFELQATGVQIYECRPNAEDAARFEWVLKAPQADLYTPSGGKVGTHYGGPTWEGQDGSKVIGAVRAKEPSPSEGSIPWLLLDARSASGEGLFGRVQSIQRLDTAGGAAPAGPPSRALAGQEVRVPYRATYAFYVAGP